MADEKVYLMDPTEMDDPRLTPLGPGAGIVFAGVICLLA